MTGNGEGACRDFGYHFRMEDGSLLIAAGRKSEGALITGLAAEGDAVFYLARDLNAAAGVLKPAGAVSVDTVEKAARLIAATLRKRSLKFDGAEEKSFKIIFGIFPAAPSIILSVSPASEDYCSRRSLHPEKRKKTVKKLAGEIGALIGEGRTDEALDLAGEIKALPADYRHKAVDEIMKKFAGIIRQIEKDGKFGIPLLLSAHSSLVSVLEVLQPGEQGGAEPVCGEALVASAEGDPGEMKDIIINLFRAAGCPASDGGADAGAGEIFAKVKRNKPSILVLCGLMPASFPPGIDPLQRLKDCRSSVKKLMGLLERENMRGGLRVVLCGLAFNRKFGRNVSADAVYRNLNALLKGLLEMRSGKGGRHAGGDS